MTPPVRGRDQQQTTGLDRGASRISPELRDGRATVKVWSAKYRPDIKISKSFLPARLTTLGHSPPTSMTHASASPAAGAGGTR